MGHSSKQTLTDLWSLAADVLGITLFIGLLLLASGQPGLLNALVGPWFGHTPVGWLVIGLFIASRLDDRGLFWVRLGAWLMATAMVIDGCQALAALYAGSVMSSLPPLSLVLALITLAPRGTQHLRLRTRIAAMAAVLLLGTWLHLFSLANTDYRRPADAAVVLGAGVYPGDVPSQAMRDRVLTAVELYQQGLVRHVVMSGGRNPARNKSEPEVMKALAVSLGVPERDIVMDPTGHDSAATIRTARALAETHHWNRVLLVSHGYHCARLQMLAKREQLQATTVPCIEERGLIKKPIYVAREVLALGATAIGLD